MKKIIQSIDLGFQIQFDFIQMMKKETKLSEHTSLFDIGHKNQDITIRLQICSKKLHYAFEK